MRLRDLREITGFVPLLPLEDVRSPFIRRHNIAENERIIVRRACCVLVAMLLAGAFLWGL